MNDYQFTDDYRTFRQAAELKGTSYEALRVHVYLHKIPTKTVGKTKVVRMSDLEGYRPRGSKQVSGV